MSSIRTEFLIGCVAKNEYAVLLMGEQGSAKTTMINSHIKTYSTETHMVMQSTFSSTTTPQLFQKSVESNVCVMDMITKEILKTEETFNISVAPEPLKKVKFQLEHCECQRRLTEIQVNPANLNFSQTTCSSDSFKRGPHQSTVLEI